MYTHPLGAAGSFTAIPGSDGTDGAEVTVGVAVSAPTSVVVPKAGVGAGVSPPSVGAGVVPAMGGPLVTTGGPLVTTGGEVVGATATPASAGIDIDIDMDADMDMGGELEGASVSIAPFGGSVGMDVFVGSVGMDVSVATIGRRVGTRLDWIDMLWSSAGDSVGDDVSFGFLVSRTVGA